MSRGGKRVGSGRKKIGKDIKVKIRESVINDINIYSTGDNQSERIRNCINVGLEYLKSEGARMNDKS